MLTNPIETSPVLANLVRGLIDERPPAPTKLIGEPTVVHFCFEDNLSDED